MSHNTTNPYDVDSHIAEVYDQCDTETTDIRLIRRFINGRGPLQILEPFSGTGRILIPLAQDGHTVTGIDQALYMIQRAQKKIGWLPEEIQMQITLIEGDVVVMAWPGRYDLVILGGNCLYELATPEEQERCIQQAAEVLKPGGYLYVDNNHMEGDLAPSWQVTGVPEKRGLAGVCADASQVETWLETIWFDAPQRLVRFRRRVEVTSPDGEVTTHEFMQQKHPVSSGEVRGWLEKYGFTIEEMFGDPQGNAYNVDSPRAIFWAKK